MVFGQSSENDILELTSTNHSESSSLDSGDEIPTGNTPSVATCVPLQQESDPKVSMSEDTWQNQQTFLCGYWPNSSDSDAEDNWEDCEDYEDCEVDYNDCEDHDDVEKTGTFNHRKSDFLFKK